MLSLVPSAPDEAGLLSRVIARSPSAAKELFDAFAPRVRALGRRLGLHAADAEDLVQDSMLVVWRRAHQINRPEQLQAFVLGVAANKARALMRRRRWARALGLEPAVTPGLYEEVAGVAATESTHELKRVNAVLQGMSDDLRVVFVLRFVEQLTLEEAAQASGWSLATLKRKAERARTVFVARARQDPLLWDRLSKEERDG